MFAADSPSNFPLFLESWLDSMQFPFRTISFLNFFPVVFSLSQYSNFSPSQAIFSISPDSPTHD